MRKSLAAAAMAASLTVGGAAGAALFTPVISGAQTDESTEESSEAPPRDGFLAEALAPLVDEGVIDESQADAVIDAIRDARPEGFGHHRHHRFPFGETLTEVLGLERDELREALAGGQTIAEIAEANGVEVQAVIDALVAELDEHLAQAVADGRLTDDEAAEKRADAVERITAMVNGELELGRPGHHGPRPGPGAQEPTES